MTFNSLIMESSGSSSDAVTSCSNAYGTEPQIDRPASDSACKGRQGIGFKMLLLVRISKS